MEVVYYRNKIIVFDERQEVAQQVFAAITARDGRVWRGEDEQVLILHL